MALGGLPRSMRKLLRADSVLWRAHQEPDEWGNIKAPIPEDAKCVVGPSNEGFGDRTEKQTETYRRTPTDGTVLYYDALDIKVGDRIQIAEEIGRTTQFEDVKRKVTQVQTYRNKAGFPVFQEVTTQTD